MKKREWQEKHGISNDTMDFIELILKESKGTITAVFDYNWEKYYKINSSRRDIE